MRGIRLAAVGFQRFLLIGLVAQIFFIGMAVFPSKNAHDPFSLHRTWGHILGIVAAILMILVLIGRFGRSTTLWSVLLFALTFAGQPLLVNARTSAPLVAALHAVNAIAIFWLTIVIGRRVVAFTKQAHPGWSGWSVLKGRTT